MATEAGVAAREPWWQALAEARARLRGVPLDPLGRPLPRARVRRHDGFVSLQFVRGQTQSRMRGNAPEHLLIDYTRTMLGVRLWNPRPARVGIVGLGGGSQRSEEHTSELQSRENLVCRLLLEKKKKKQVWNRTDCAVTLHII